MPKNVKCKNCNNLNRHHWCEKVLDSPDKERVRDCQHFWQKTNGDLIRAMSDDELAEIIREITYTGACNDFSALAKTPCPHNCKECALEWLQQPVKED